MQQKESEDNIIKIGKRPFMNYVTSVIIQFTQKKSEKVIIVARGKFISRAVDVAELIRRKLLKNENIKVEEVKIGSEDFTNSNRQKSVSSISITLKR